MEGKTLNPYPFCISYKFNVRWFFSWGIYYNPQKRNQLPVKRNSTKEPTRALKQLEEASGLIVQTRFQYLVMNCEDTSRGTWLGLSGIV
ncbi:hypothetical protein NC652_006566 [Populus alba x Populus x berolinensis]|nr:hypothetical protein NC652_006566 [Populus alba x Populus x berolinensis]